MVCNFHLRTLIKWVLLISNVNTLVLKFYFKYLNKKYLYIYLFSEKFPRVDHFIDTIIQEQQINCKDIKKIILLCIVVHYFQLNNSYIIKRLLKGNTGIFKINDLLETLEKGFESTSSILNLLLEVALQLAIFEGICD